MPAPTAYSGTPLAKKLGFKPGGRVFLVDPPEGYAELLEPLPAGVAFERAASGATDLVHVFCTRQQELASLLNQFRATLRPDAVLWVSWPKKTSKLPTTVTEGTIRELALPLGFVDIKVCAVNEIWSGLKLVLRKELR